jgi:hypothetical protein
MPTRYVLIDYENVQPKDLAVLDGQPFHVVVFLGANQAKISSELADALQQRGELGRYVRVSGNGRNALDFHIAFYLGELAAKNPKAQFHVVSKDKGFEPLLAHLRLKGIEVQRAATLAAVVPQTDDKLGTVIAHLKGMGHARPRRTKTLASTINAKLGKGLDESEIQSLIDELQRRGVVSLKDGKVTYPFTAESQGVSR